MSHNQTRGGGGVGGGDGHGHGRRTGRSGSFGGYRNKSVGSYRKAGNGVRVNQEPGGMVGFAPAVSPVPVPVPAQPRDSPQNGAHSPSIAQPHPPTVQPPLAVGASDKPSSATSAIVYPDTSRENLVNSLPSSNSSSEGAMHGPPVQPSPLSKVVEPVAPVAAAAAKGDQSKAHGLIFGTVNIGLMNGIPIPARTSSAPPNLDEQKRNQALQEVVKSVPPQLPLPPALKQQPRPQLPQQQEVPRPQQQQVPQSRKDTTVTTQVNSGQPLVPAQVKKDIPALPQSVPSSAAPRAPIPSVPGMHVHVPFHHQLPQVAVHIGGPGPQMQTQGLGPNSMQIPIALPGGNPSQLQQPMFIPSHALQQQPMLHQPQNIGYVPSHSHQIHPPLGNLGISMSQQYPPQQQTGKFGNARKPVVKITHPETHEEVKLDNVYSGQRNTTNIVQHSQPVPSFSPLGNYGPLANSYGAPQLYFHSPGNVFLANSQISNVPQGPRYSFPQSGQAVTFMGPQMLNVIPGGNLDNTAVAPCTPAPVQVTVKPPVGVNMDRSMTSAVIISMPPSKLEEPRQERSEDSTLNFSKTSEAKFNGTDFTSKAVSEMGTSIEVTDGKKTELVERADSFKEHGIRPIPKDFTCSYEKPQISLSPAEDVKLSSLVKNSSSTTQSQPYTGDAGNCQFPESDSGSLMQRLPSVDVHGSKTFPVDECDTAILSSPEDNSLEQARLSSSVENKEHVAHSPEFEIKTISSNTEGIALSEEVQEEEFHASVECLTDTGLQLEVTTKDPSELSISKSRGKLETLSSTSSIADGEDSEPFQRHQIDISSEAVNIKMEEFSSIEPQISDSPALSEAIAATSEAATAGNFTAETANTVLRVPEIDHNIDSSSISSNLVQMQRSGFAIKENFGISPVSAKDAPSDSTKSKSSVGKKKRRLKEITSKADAAGSSDLYIAYKGPAENVDDDAASESVTSSFTLEAADCQPDEPEIGAHKADESIQAKFEHDDWEDATEISIPKLRPSKDGEPVIEANKLAKDDECEATHKKKYTRDFLLTLMHQYNDLPVGFQVGPDVAILMNGLAGNRDSIPNSTRPPSRGDRRVNFEDVKWAKSAGLFSSGRDMRLDIDNGPSGSSFRPQVSPSGRNTRGHQSNAYAGGIMGPGQPVLPYTNLPRNSSDADRWQHSPMQRGLMPSPSTPMPGIHKAEKKYEIGKISDQEAAKQRQLKAILNKLTPQNFEKLFAQVKEVNIDNRVTLTGVISQIFDKALMEPTFCEMYADFCSHLAGALPDFSEDNEKITFKRMLLDKCQEEFERGEREEAEADKTEEGEIELSKEVREEKRLRARRRMLGNIRLIGELYKKKMLTERIMHECIKKLLGQYQNPDEEDIEALCKLMSTIGGIIDHEKAKEHMDAYFDIMNKMSTNQKLSSRVRFMLRDTIDLRKNKWQQRRKVDGPKKIEEVHRDAAQEKTQSSRGGRGPVGSSNPRRPPDFGSRGPGSQQVGLRTQVRGFGVQDARLDERHRFENRTMSLPLAQRSGRDESITLGPQGGLARGMSIRSQQPILNADLPVGEHSRMMHVGSNGYNTVADTAPHSREDSSTGVSADRSSSHATLHHQSNLDERNSSWSSRPAMAPTVPNPRSQGLSTSNLGSLSGAKSYSEEQLQEKSVSAIKEYYSAKDDNEVVLCIEELHSPSFHPSVVSLWVTDSFERKDLERNLLAGLLVKLCRRQGALLTHAQLIQGLASVLFTFEDAVNDAPRASEFLGQLFAKLITESVVSLKEVGNLIQEGGEEPGYLIENGLAADVLASTLESIRSNMGESFMREAIASSNLKLAEFRSPQSNISKLDALI